MARCKNNIQVSQLTAYERRRLNQDRRCVICTEPIHDYDMISFATRRDQRNVDYVFAHYECDLEMGYPDLFKCKGD